MSNYSKFVLYFDSAFAIENAALERLQWSTAKQFEEEERIFEGLKANAPAILARLWSRIDSLC